MLMSVRGLAASVVQELAARVPGGPLTLRISHCAVRPHRSNEGGAIMRYLNGIVRRAVCAALLTLLVVWSVGTAPVRAATTRHVTTCDGNAGTAGSLPAQVAAAGAGDTIVFDRDCQPASPIMLVASLTPAVDLTIDGTGHTVAVDGGCTISGGICTFGTGVAVFQINSGRTIGLVALTIQHGLGGIKQNGGTLTVTNSTITANGGVTQGAGILAANGSTLTITNSAITGNDAAVGIGGGIIANNTTLTITGSTIMENSTGQGGGIAQSGGGTLTMTNSTVSGNTAKNFGGGGLALGIVTANITASTISGNTANQSGGGIKYSVISSVGSLTLVNSTIANNTVTGVNASGGGLFASGSPAGTVIVVGSTISGNTDAGSSGTISGGGMHNEGGVMSLANTVVAGNTSTGTDPDVFGAFASGKYNFIGDGGDATGLVNNVNSDRVGTAASPLNSQLGTLADNGGPTQTMRPQTGSPLLDKIPALGGCNNQGTAVDQRGVPRPQNLSCDIGAVELVTGTFATATALAANPTTVPAGAPVTFTATVTSAAPAALTGTVSFLDGSTTLGSAPVNVSGAATFATTFATAGTHSLTALFSSTASGDIQFNPSSSTPQNFSVTASLTAIAPTTGSAAGGTPLTLTGTGFLPSATVSIGGVPCANIQATSNTTLTCVAPAHSAGAVDVAVTTAGVTETLTGAYTFTVTLASIGPASGGTAGGNTVTLTGAGFLTGATVTLGGIATTNCTVVSGTTLTCTAPAHAAGAVDVTVTTAGVTRTLTNGYTYGTVTTLPPPPPSSASSGNPNALPDQRSVGGTSGNPNILPLPRP